MSTIRDLYAMHYLAGPMIDTRPEYAAQDACDIADALANEACKRWGHEFNERHGTRGVVCDRCGADRFPVQPSPPPEDPGPSKEQR